MKRKQTILMIEDEKKVIESYAPRLKKAGFEVVEALDGEGGLKTAFEKHPDLILLDLLLPKIEGMELLLRLRKNLWGKRVPVIIISNLSRPDWIAKAAELGVYEYLSKSGLSIDDVVLKVQMQLSGKQDKLR